MKRPMHWVLIILFCATYSCSIADEKANPTEIQVDLPEVTPYDNQALDRAVYLEYFFFGYQWASGQHLKCPPNSPPSEHRAVLHGWIDGFKKGVENGGTSDFPSKYLKYLTLADAA